MLIGEYIHSIDSKKRLAIPSKFRIELGSKLVLTRGLDNSLFLYPKKDWDAFVEKLKKLPLGQSDNRSFARLMLSGAIETEIDNLGRILIPEYLKDYALLKKKVVLVGVLNRLEIWSEENWQEYKNKAEKSIGDVAEKLGGLGI